MFSTNDKYVFNNLIIASDSILSVIEVKFLISANITATVISLPLEAILESFTILLYNFGSRYCLNVSVIFSGLFFNDDGAVGTHHCTHSAADARTFVGAISGKNAFLIALFMLQSNDLLRAGSCAKLAALAAVKNDSHFRHNSHQSSS